MEVSIVTSLYNKSLETVKIIDFLFFNSIKNHGQKNRELIILDDHSPLEKETKELFKKHEKDLKKVFGRVIFKRNSRNCGFSGSFNKAIALAKGKNIFIVNDDVYLPKDSVTRLIDVLNESEKYGISSPITGEKNTWTIQYCKQAPKLKSYSKENLKEIEEFARYAHNIFSEKRIGTKYVAGFCLAIKADLIKKLGGFDEIFKFGLWEDVDLSRRVSKNFDIIVNPGIYVHHGSIKGISTSMLQHPFKAIKRFVSNAGLYGKKWHDFLGVLWYIIRGEYMALTSNGTVSRLFAKIKRN